LYRPALVSGLLLTFLATPVVAEETSQRSEYQQGLEATWTGDYEKARGHLEAHLAETPGDASAILALARVEFWTNRYEESIALYDQYLELRPHDIDAKVELGHSLFWAGDLARTETVARDAVAIEAENIKANLVLAAVLQSTEREEEADAVYDWVLQLDPDNVNAKNRQALQPRGVSHGDAFALTSRSHVAGDNFDFIGFRSVTGFAVGIFGILTLEPQLRVRIIDDPRVKAPYTGAGPGLKLGISTGTPVSLWARGAYIPMVGKEQTVDAWSAGAGIDVRVAPELSLWGSYNTELHGLERQSAFAVHEGFRRHEGLLGVYWAPAWFRLVASAAGGGIFDRGAELGLNMSWWLSPAVRVKDGRWTVYVGYGSWGMVYQDPAPERVAPSDGVPYRTYWDPAAALSHMIYVDLDAELTPHWKLLANLGGGLAQERDWATATRDASWTAAALVNGRLSVGWSPSAAFEARLGGGFGVSNRGGDHYTSWNALLDLIGRW